MGRLVDIDAVCKAIADEWYGCCADYTAQEIIDDTIHAVEQVEEVEAIPVDWIKSYLSDCAEGSIAYYVIKQMLYKWRKEREGE